LNFHGTAEVDGSSPSEGFSDADQVLLVDADAGIRSKHVLSTQAAS